MLQITNAPGYFFNSKEAYLKFKSNWSSYVNRKGRVTPELLFVYSLLRGKTAINGFTPITNTNRLKNGNEPWQRFQSARTQISLLGNENWKRMQWGKERIQEICAIFDLTPDQVEILSNTVRDNDTSVIICTPT